MARAGSTHAIVMHHGWCHERALGEGIERLRRRVKAILLVRGGEIVVKRASNDLTVPKEEQGGRECSGGRAHEGGAFTFVLNLWQED